MTEHRITRRTGARVNVPSVDSGVPGLVLTQPTAAKTGACWTVTHAASGITPLGTAKGSIMFELDAAKDMAQRMGRLGDWTRSADVLVRDTALKEKIRRLLLRHTNAFEESR